MRQGLKQFGTGTGESYRYPDAKSITINACMILAMLISLNFRTKQVIKVMRAKDKGGKKIGSNKYK